MTPTPSTSDSGSGSEQNPGMSVSPTPVHICTKVEITTSLSGNDVHVWLTNLDTEPHVVDALARLLSSDELKRAARFHFDRDRQRYIVGRGSLRQLLASYLDADPATLQFSYGPNGKPALKSDSSGLQFNLSHSQDRAAVAITRDHEVGVDIEYVRPEFAQETIAEQFFSKQECAALRALPVAHQARAFFDCWTRKEAFVKASGSGLTFGLADFDVSLSSIDHPPIHAIRGDANEAGNWTLYSIAPAHNVVLAVALRAKECRFTVRHSPVFI